MVSFRWQFRAGWCCLLFCLLAASVAPQEANSSSGTVSPEPTSPVATAAPSLTTQTPISTTASPPIATTDAPSPTTRTPTPTTKAPDPTTATPPDPTTRTPDPTTRTPDPTTKTPDPTTRTPDPTTETPDPTTRTPTPPTRTPTPTTRTPTPTTDAPGPTTPSPSTKAPEPPVSTTQAPTSTPISTTDTPSTDPSTTAPTSTKSATTAPATTTAAPVVKRYNSSTLPPTVSSNVLNGTKLDTVEVTETADANGTTTYNYTIVTTDGKSVTRVVYVPASGSSTGADAATQPGSALSDGDKSSGLGVGAVVGIIVGSLVFILVLLAFFVARRRHSKHRFSDADSEDVLASPAVGKQVRLLQNGMETEYHDITRTTANTRSSGDSSRGYHSTLWEDPVITAARIPIDRVEMGAIISRGGFGEVYRGRYRDQDVAIKTLLPEKRKDMQYIQAFLSEVRLMATMEHPNIVEFIGVAWESLSDLYCVTEFMAGGDLRTLLKDYLLTGVPQGMDASKMQIAYHVAHALTYLHSLEPVVLHRDLKSRNILLTTSLHAKLTDFGTSRIRSDSTMTAGVGSSLWMAPEVMMGKRYDEKADVFSLGVVMSELDTHELPYSHAKEPSDNSSGVRSLPDAAILQMVSTGKLRVRFSRFLHPEMVRFANTCVSVDPRERPTAAEVLYFLQVAIRNQQF